MKWPARVKIMHQRERLALRCKVIGAGSYQCHQGLEKKKCQNWKSNLLRPVTRLKREDCRMEDFEQTCRVDIGEQKPIQLTFLRKLLSTRQSNKYLDRFL
jgi:hypothetical protein